MRKKREPVDVGDLNLIPLMNLVCLLIPFLLLSAQFIQIGIILVQTPRLRSQSSADDQERTEALDLTVVMTGRGYYIKSRFGSECPPGKGEVEENLCFRNKEDGKFTTEIVEELQNHMWYLFAKKYEASHYYENPRVDRHTITLTPQFDVKYEDVIRTLDALREIPTRATDPKPPSVPPGGCRMEFDRGAGSWFVTGGAKGDAAEQACMYHLVTLAIGAT